MESAGEMGSLTFRAADIPHAEENPDGQHAPLIAMPAAGPVRLRRLASARCGHRGMAGGIVRNGLPARNHKLFPRPPGNGTSLPDPGRSCNVQS
jgi:hypothetical protein